MTTAITTTNQQLPARTHLGDRNQIAAIHSRLASMMHLPPDVPADVVWATAQIAAAHHLDPFVGEIYIMPTGYEKNAAGQWEQQYRPYVSIMGYRKIARERANFTAKLETMDAAEVERLRGDLYEPADVGVRCTLWRLDVARDCKDAGIPYEPVIGLGFWRVKAQWNKKNSEWMADNIPNTWTAQQVAEKRAERHAIKKAYDMPIFAGGDSDADGEAVGYVVDKVRDEEMRTALPAPRNDVVVEDDGEILFATSDAQRNGKKQAATPSPVAQQENIPGDTETTQDAPPAQPDAIWEDAPTDAPDPVTVALGELTGQKLGVILEWGMAHGQMSKDEARTLWDSIRANGLDGPATLVGFVRTILAPVEE